MIAIISLLVVLSLSILVTRVATIALSHTGMSQESARFQARSAFTGVGFTTSEAERVVNHPVRRRILLILMLLGNAGIITAVSSLILGFMAFGNSQSAYLKVVLLVAGLIFLLFISQSQWVDKRLSRLIKWALNRYTTLDVKDYASILQLGGDYRVSELIVEPQDWLAGKILREAQLQDEGILILGIHRGDGRFVGAPHGETKIEADDTLIIYGREEDIEELDNRSKGYFGDKEHKQAVEEQEQLEQQQEAGENGKAESEQKQESI